ncbi:MAG: sugar-binding protein [Eubacteriales bacterium]
MKIFKIASMILIMTTLVLTLSISIHADPDKSINAEYGTPIIDGVVDDIWNKCTGALTTNIYQGADRITDTVSEWKMMWDENKIYILVQVKDKEINSNNMTFWQNDCTQLFIDLVNSKDFDTYDYDGTGEQLGVRWSVPGLLEVPDNFLVEFLGGGGYYLETDEPLYLAFEKAMVIGGEGFIQEYSFDPRLFYTDFKLQAGTQGGVDFINDDSIAGSDIRDILFHWSVDGDTWSNPQNLSVFTLAEKKDDPAPAAVEAAPAQEAAPTQEAAPVSAPQTSDMGMGLFALAALASGCSIINRIKKSKKN